jgi:hypothetical protein
MIPATPVRGTIPVATVDMAETVMDSGDTAMKSVSVKTTGVEPAAVKTTAVKTPGVKTAGVKTAAVKTAAMPSASARVRGIWLAEDSCAQQRGCNAHHSLCLSRSGFVIA